MLTSVFPTPISDLVHIRCSIYMCRMRNTEQMSSRPHHPWLRLKQMNCFVSKGLGSLIILLHLPDPGVLYPLDLSTDL